MMKKSKFLFMGLALTLCLAGCSSKQLPTQKKDDTVTQVDNEQVTNDSEETPVKKDLKLADTLNINFAVGNNQRTMTYNQATPLVMPNGSVISQGDLKPMWQYVSSQIGVALKDVTVQDQKAEEMIEISAATNFTSATIYGGAKGEDYMNYGSQGYFLDLSTRLDDMPNIKAYFEKNPNIKDAITAYDGGIYYIPYVAEVGNYARVFHGRESWVLELLGSTNNHEPETQTLNVAYKGYWDLNETNVIALQNAAAKNGVLTRDAALNVLLDYIKTTYPELSKPSDLYLNENAKYNIDELIALWRVIKLSPNTLSKVTTGNVVQNAMISPFFVRNSSYREDILRLAVYFGGQRVFGADDYGSKFYLNENGELTFSYADDNMIEVYEYLSQIYSEGLVHTEFADLNTKDDFRKALYASDKNEGQQQFGFMTIDWIASTTASNPDVVGMLPPMTTLGSDEFIHFMENTRTIKPEGWAITTSATEEEINAAIVLFDYFFSKEGSIAQNYGIPEMLEEKLTFLGPDYIDYPRFKDWVFLTATEFKNGDVSAFLRDFVGALMPIGYQKEIGFEYQYTVYRGWDAWDIYNKANVQSLSYDATNPLFKLVPSVFSLTEQNVAKLSNNSVGSTQVDSIFLYITNSEIALDSASDIKKAYVDAGLTDYVAIYQDAYKRISK
jgi:hypothetical protein